MITPITTIKTHEQSPAVANLQAALGALGLHVDPAEVAQQRAGASTTKLVRRFQKQMKITPKRGYLVDEATAAALNKALTDEGAIVTVSAPTYLVSGTVTDPSGQPARGFTVVASDKDMRTLQELGRTVTDSTGEYEISYGPAQVGAGETNADLVVQVYAPAGDLVAGGLARRF